jgi:bidirectional [NiFe] hydrogenase diaphorase subunit
LALDAARPSVPTDDGRWQAVETRMRQLGNRPEALIEALHATQEQFGYIDEQALRYIAATLNLPPSKVYGVATFYHYFRLRPHGEHIAVVCTGTACYIDGAGELIDAVGRELEVEPGATSADGRLSLMTARCIGACSLAPAAIVDDDVLGRVKAADLVSLLRDL